VKVNGVEVVAGREEPDPNSGGGEAFVDGCSDVSSAYDAME